MLWVWWAELASGLQQMSGLLRDPRLVNYTLEHGFRWVMRFPLHRDFWQTPLFYPYPEVTAFTDVLVGLGPIYWIWRWLGAEPDTAFQLWMLVCWSLNFWVAALFLHRGLGVGVLAASLGATLAAFGGAQMSRLWHPQLLPLFLVYLGALAVFEIFRAVPEEQSPRARRGWCAVLAAVAVLQAYTAFYPFFFFGLLAVLAIAWAGVRRKTRARIFDLLRREGPFLAGCGAIAGLLVAPLALQYLATATEIGVRPFSTRFAPRPASWFLLGPDNYLFGWLQRDGGPFVDLAEMEHSGGIGFLSAIVASVGLVAARRRAGVWILACATASLMLIATQLGEFSPWRWVHAHVPGAGGIRAISRISMILTLAVPVGIALLADRLARTRRRVWLTAIALLCLVEQPRAPFPHVSKVEVREKIARLAARVDESCAAFLLVNVGPPGYLTEDDDAAWVQLATRKPTVNGRYGNNPRHWKLYRHQSDGAVPDPARLRLALSSWLRRFAIDPRRACWIEYR